MFPELNQSSLLVHITFHYVADRVTYLEQVLKTLYSYPFSTIEIIIDSNTDELELAKLPQPPQSISLLRHTHTKLDHPFLLTWAHRPHVEQNAGDYDYFMYIEDDMIVPSGALEHWLKESRRLYPLGYLSGFLRTERTADNTLVSTDQTQQTTKHDIRRIAGQYYYYPPNPYHGFWVYSQAQLQDFISSSCWRDGNHPDWGVRELAAAGMMWRETSHHITLIPLKPDLEVPETVLASHIPNNYALDEANQYGNVPIARLTQLDWIERLKLRLTASRTVP